MDAPACRRCGAQVTAGARFCTQCGLPLTAAPAAGADAAAGDASAPSVAPHHDADIGQALVECDVCGAGNAASRPLCARCGTPLREEVPGGNALPAQLPVLDPPPRPSRLRGEGPSVLLALVVLAGLLTAGVLLALVTSRVTTPARPPVPTGVDLAAATASAARQDHPPSAAVDGDPTTAWIAPADDDGQAWLEVVLTTPATVDGLLVWNGAQADEQTFLDHGRAVVIRIEVGERTFRTALRDTTGPQAVRLPEGVRAGRVRLLVEDALTGRRHADLAISEVVVREAGGQQDQRGT